MTAITLLKVSIKYGPSNMGDQGMLHRAASFKRRQNRVGVHWRALKDLVTERIRERIQNRGAAAGNGRLADTTRAHRRLRIRNVQGGPLHINRDIQDRWRLVVMEPPGNHLSVVWIEHPLLTDGMSDAQDRAPKYLTTQGSGMDYCTDVGRSEEVYDVVLAGFDVDFNFGKAGDIRKSRAVAWIVILGRRHQTLTC